MTSTVKKVPVAIRWSAVVLAVGGLVLWLVLYAPAHFVPASSEADLRKVDAAKRLELQNDVRGTLLQGLGGLAVLVGAFLALRQLQTAREGQVTERFTRAIDQLGHENLDVRLGGIYALERIANDSSEDRASVAQVLTAFVRGHAPWPPSRPNQPPSGASILAVPPLRVRAADVQATLTVLGRGRPWMSPPGSLDLRVSDLRRADLAGARLRRANLFSAQLQEAILMDANLQEANLGDAYLKGAHLTNAQLQQADLWNAKLQEADLRGAQLQKADLRDARLQQANLHRTQLQGARCNAKTVWPAGFDWQAAGVELLPASESEEARRPDSGRSAEEQGEISD